MPKTEIYTGVDFHIYPLQLFILFVGFILGVIIGSLNDKRHKSQQNDSSQQSTAQQSQTVIHQSSSNAQSSQQLILSYSLSTGQSFDVNNKRYKLFKGHLYQYLPLDFQQNQQGLANNGYEISRNCITKKSKENQWVKLYNPLMQVPKSGKFYFNVFVVKNEYFVKRQTSQKPQSNLAVSRTDIIIGFILAKTHPNILQLSQQLTTITHQAQRDTNGIPGIAAYGFNGKIYSNGDLRIEEKIIKKNKTLTVLVNRDDGYLAFQVEGQTVGFIVLPKDKEEIVPFVEMFAVGSSVVISS